MQLGKCFNCMQDFDMEIDTICPHCGYYQEAQSEEEDKAQALRPGTIIAGKYYIGKVLGIGGFAITYVAYNYALQCKVAVKEYFPMGRAERAEDGLTVDCGTGDNAEQFRMGLDQFASESHRLAKVGNHQGIVNIFEAFYENETAYIAMEFINGDSLEKKLTENGVMDYMSLLKIIVPICGSLDRIHKNEHIIHRDIAPDNIMLQGNGKAKLIDFGASLDNNQVNENVILKHGYAPIEQYDPDQVSTERTDVYAMCAVIYHMITGKKPPRSDERQEAVLQGEEDPLLTISQQGVELPAALEQTIMQGLSILPEDRVADMDTLTRRLSVHMESEFVPPEINQDPPPKLLRIIIPVVAGVVVIAAVVLFALFGSGNKVSEEKAIACYPDVIGKTVSEAKKAVRDKESYKLPDGETPVELTFNIVKSKATMATDDEDKDGTIARQEKAAGEEIKDSEADAENGLDIVVTLYKYDPDSVRTGDELTEVPSLVGKTEKKAKTLLKEAELTNYEFTNAFSEEVEKGKVISQSVKAGKNVRTNKKITVVISDGPQPTTLPPTTYKQPEVSTKPSYSPSTTQKPKPKKPTTQSPSEDISVFDIPTQAPTKAPTQPATQAPTKAPTQPATDFDIFEIN